MLYTQQAAVEGINLLVEHVLISDLLNGGGADALTCLLWDVGKGTGTLFGGHLGAGGGSLASWLAFDGSDFDLTALREGCHRLWERGGGG